MSNPVHLESERLIVRDWRVDEVDGIHRWLGNPSVGKFIAFGANSREESEQHLHGTVIPSQNLYPRKEYFLAVELIESGQTIGNVGFDWKGSKSAEIGYFFEPSSWGFGYAQEASNLIIQFAFDLGAESVLAACDEDNIASEKVMQRCGLSRQAPIEAGRLLYKIDVEDFLKTRGKP